MRRTDRTTQTKRRCIGPAMLGGLLLVVAAAAEATAAAAEGHPRFGPILLGLAVLVVSAKVGGLLAERWGQPSVLGELLAGIGLGNLLPMLGGMLEFALFRSDPTLVFLAEVGVLVLLFDVGLEADLRAFARVGVSSLLVAMLGVAMPIALGWGGDGAVIARQPPRGAPLHWGHALGHQRRDHGARAEGSRRHPKPGGADHPQRSHSG
jgi:hypothetical protein